MRFLPILLALLLVCPATLAVGFANLPKDREIIFSPGDSVNIPVFVHKSPVIQVGLEFPQESDPTTIGTPSDDNIGEYVRIDDPEPLGGQRRVTLVFDFPNSMRPGTYPVNVIASEASIDAEGGITARAAVKMQFIVRVLTDEPLIDITSLSAAPIPEGVNAKAGVGIASRTTQSLSDVFAEVKVYDNGKEVASGRSSSFSLESAEKKGVQVPLSTALLTGGEYKMNVTLLYVGREAHRGNAVLKIGALNVAIKEYTKELLYNSTNKFTFIVENQWNQQLQEVFAFVKLAGQNKKTASIHIPAFGSTEYEIYFDRDPKIQVGKAIVNVTVNFKDYNPVSKNYESKTETIPLEVQIVQPFVEEKSSIPITAIIMYSMLGALILLLVIIIILLLRRQKGEKK
ncbi:hypothetical protein GOV11_04360 [Candidatus Woesearchaeota archaeon]|nr:hypothetical protein [Candidatus Woesearchaeota archaeon]